MQRFPSAVLARPRDASADPYAADAPQSALLYREAVANPSPLGLFAFSVTCITMSASNAGLTEARAAHHRVSVYGMLYGGFAQILAAIYELKRGSTFGAVTFYTYGGYWVGLSLYFLFHDAALGGAASLDAVSNGPRAEAVVNALYCALSLVFLGGSLRINRATQAIFLGLAGIYLLLTVGSFVPLAVRIAGGWGMVTGAIGFYTGVAELYNEVYGFGVLPLGEVGRPVPAKEEVGGV